MESNWRLNVAEFGLAYERFRLIARDLQDPTPDFFWSFLWDQPGRAWLYGQYVSTDGEQVITGPYTYRDVPYCYEEMEPDHD